MTHAGWKGNSNPGPAWNPKGTAASTHHHTTAPGVRGVVAASDGVGRPAAPSSPRTRSLR